MSLLYMTGEIPSQIVLLSFHYWFLAPISLLFVLSLFYFFRNGAAFLSASHAGQTPRRWAWELLILFIAVSLAVVGGRGGGPRRPLTTPLAPMDDKEKISPLAVNSTSTLIYRPHKSDTTNT